jgi:hypothetical protein
MLPVLLLVLVLVLVLFVLPPIPPLLVPLLLGSPTLCTWRSGGAGQSRAWHGNDRVRASVGERIQEKGEAASCVFLLCSLICASTAPSRHVHQSPHVTFTPLTQPAPSPKAQQHLHSFQTVATT